MSLLGCSPDAWRLGGWPLALPSFSASPEPSNPVAPGRCQDAQLAPPTGPRRADGADPTAPGLPAVYMSIPPPTPRHPAGPRGLPPALQGSQGSGGLAPAAAISLVRAGAAAPEHYRPAGVEPEGRRPGAAVVRARRCARAEAPRGQRGRAGPDWAGRARTPKRDPAPPARVRPASCHPIPLPREAAPGRGRGQTLVPPSTPPLARKFASRPLGLGAPGPEKSRVYLPVACQRLRCVWQPASGPSAAQPPTARPPCRAETTG